MKQVKRSEIKRVKPALKSFNCKNCGSVVEITVLGQTLNVICPSCNSVIDANDPDFAILEKGIKQKKYYPDIPLRSRGKLHGTLWEVTGFLVKSDSGYYWREYLLFNPYKGYRWLVEVDGHWALYRRIRNYSKERLDSIYYKKKHFKLFNRGSAKVEHVEGEFFWRVKRGDRTKVEDFIDPPYGISVERTKREQNWTYGHHVEARAVKTAFNVKDSLPGQSGVGQLQPSTLKDDFKKSIFTCLIALTAVFVIFIVREATANKEIVFSRKYSKNSISDTLTEIKTEEFDLTGGTSNVKFYAKANVRNNWAYFNALLVDAKTQKGIPMPLEVSYYYGNGWSEGSQKKTRYVYNVPDGRYYISIKSQYGKPRYRYSRARRNDSITALFELRRDSTVISNTIITVILIIIGPIFTLFRSGNFETRRWSNSDYSPYEH